MPLTTESPSPIYYCGFFSDSLRCWLPVMMLYSVLA
jgi:hypothetical protein